MNLHKLLQARQAQGRAVRVALIGAGKFGAMYLAQARRTPGIHILAVALLRRPGGALPASASAAALGSCFLRPLSENQPNGRLNRSTLDVIMDMRHGTAGSGIGVYS